MSDIIYQYLQLLYRAKEIVSILEEDSRWWYSGLSELPCELEVDGDVTTLVYPRLESDYSGPGYIVMDHIDFDGSLLYITDEEFKVWKKTKAKEKKAFERAKEKAHAKTLESMEYSNYLKLKQKFEGDVD